MSPPCQSEVRNHLLRAMRAGDFALLQPHLVPVTTVLQQVMIAPDSPVTQLALPESGFVSVVSDGTRTIEVGLIGREGMIGATPLLLGGDRSLFAHVVQGAGEVFAIGAEQVGASVERSPSLRDLLLRFVQTLLVQTAQTAFVNASLDIEARLAHWLLMCQDRVGDDTLVLTHEFLSMMLGVQRTSVTLALQTLEGRGLIRARRGRVDVRRRDLLKDVAGEGYGVPEAEYARLIGAA